MKVKILDVDLIRRYGSSNIDMDMSLAIRLRKEGKVKIIGEVSEYENPDTGTILIFNKKEEVKETKEKEENKPEEKKRIPADNEPIFPQNIIGGKK